MRPLISLFAVIVLMAIAGLVVKDRLQWLATALFIASAILLAVLLLAVGGVL